MNSPNFSAAVSKARNLLGVVALTSLLLASTGCQLAKDGELGMAIVLAPVIVPLAACAAAEEALTKCLTDEAPNTCK